MARNIIDAICEIVNYSYVHIGSYKYRRSNSEQADGDVLEQYIADVFAGTMLEHNKNTKKQLQKRVFSYGGEANFPPDLIIRGGDAIEIKKTEGLMSDIPLNSSYPKDKLRANNTKISDNCRNCEEWTEKDIIYAIGHIPKESTTVKALAFIYGVDYCANESHYKFYDSAARDMLRSIPNIDYVEDSNELLLAHNVDPLNRTYFRARGMWGIESPFSIFKDYVNSKTRKKNEKPKFELLCIINRQKLSTFDNFNRLKELAISNTDLTITDITIDDPNNKMGSIDAVLIKYLLWH